MPRLGVLALQGDFEAHRDALARLGVEPVEVRRCAQLAGLQGLVIPGGESTTLLNLMRDEPWFERLRAFHREGGVLLGTCAGAILLSRKVVDPTQPSLGLLDATIRRNAYGRQIDSFETEVHLAGGVGSLPAVFIRAPRFVSLGPEVEVLAEHEGEPVLVQQARIMAVTFHPELTRDLWLQRRFVQLAARSSDAAVAPPTVVA